MKTEKNNSLVFKGVDIVKCFLEVGDGLKDKDSIDFSVEAKVFFPEKEPEGFKVIMSAKIALDDEGFFLMVVGIGAFKIKGEVTEDTKKKLVNVNAAAIMFPYIRAYITTITSCSPHFVDPLVMPARFFHGDLEEVQNSEFEDESYLNRSIEN